MPIHDLSDIAAPDRDAASLIINDHARDALDAMPAGLAQIAVTGPPYFAQRDYAADGQIGAEGSPADYVAARPRSFAFSGELCATTAPRG